MKGELFAELLSSIREGGRILWGEGEPTREFHNEESDVVANRENDRIGAPGVTPEGGAIL